MLTKDDISQIKKTVREVVREEVENEITVLKDEIQADIAMSRIRVQQDISELKDRIKNLEITVTRMHKELKTEIKMASHFLDKENMQTLKRVQRIEKHVNIVNPIG